MGTLESEQDSSHVKIGDFMPAASLNQSTEASAVRNGLAGVLRPHVAGIQDHSGLMIVSPKGSTLRHEP